MACAIMRPMAPHDLCMYLNREAKKMARRTELTISDVIQSPSRAARAVGWTSLAVGITALGLYVGRELRIRYKFSHRTPSDFFSHAGEDIGPEFGMGI